MSVKVCIVGMGIINAIGIDPATCFQSLEKGTTGVGDMKWLKSRHAGLLPVAEVNWDNKKLADETGVKSRLPRTTLLSIYAARQALNSIGLDKGNNTCRIGLISANTVGGMDLTEDFYLDYRLDHSKGRLRDIIHHECGDVTEQTARFLNIKDAVGTINTACSSSANAIMLGSRWVRSGMLDLVLVGGADALSRFTLNGFNTLMLADKEHSRPFDATRAGLNLGEGAAYLVLATEKTADKLKLAPGTRVAGYANANDAHHQTASSPEGIGSFLAMSQALASAGLKPEDINYVNLHGTGTANNDASEGAAISRLFDPIYPPMSSTKAFTGHTLGAAGAIEAVFSVLSIENGAVFPNLNLHQPIPELPFVPTTRFDKGMDINHVMSNSFGFGGNCTSLIFSKN